MLKNLAMLTAVGAIAAATSACLDFEHKSTPGAFVERSGRSERQLDLDVDHSFAEHVHRFQWNVTEHTETSASGAFSATCAGQLKLSGNAKGTLSGSIITWEANGNATAAGLASCANQSDR